MRALKQFQLAVVVSLVFFLAWVGGMHRADGVEPHVVRLMESDIGHRQSVKPEAGMLRRRLEPVIHESAGGRIAASTETATDPTTSGAAAAVYQNARTGPFAYFPPGAGVLLGDDLRLAGTRRQLVGYSGVCVFSPAETPPYDVHIELWTDVGNGTSPQARIPGTACTAVGIPSGTEEDATNYGNCQFGPGSGVVLPEQLWMVLDFSTDAAAWMIAETAELGFTEDWVWTQPPGLLGAYGNIYSGHCTSISAEPSALCGPPSGDCCSANGTTGCSLTTCCDLVCSIDPFCCGDSGGAWDSVCALIAARVCDGVCPPPQVGPCCDDVTADCFDAVDPAVCSGPFIRYGGDGLFCFEMEPPCGRELPCCIPNGGCSVVPAAVCETELGGQVAGDCADCAPAAPPPPDYLGGCPTGTGGTTSVGFGVGNVPAIPAGFFGPGSDVFTGPVEFAGDPIDPVNLGNTSTIIQRDADPVSPGDPVGSTGTVGAEIVQLSLVSTKPITVTFNGLQDPQSWEVRVELSDTAVRPGALTATKLSDNGGTFDCSLVVRPRFLFRNLENPFDVRVLDAGLNNVPPIPLTSQSVPFIHQPLPDLDVVFDPLAEFIPGVAQIVLDDVVSQVPVPFANFSEGVTHTVCPPRPEKHCIYRVKCVEGTCGTCPLNADDTCYEFQCFDTCPVGFSRTCGGQDCCIEYELVDCRLRGQQHQCLAGEPCACRTPPPPDRWSTWTDGRRNRSYQDLELPPGFFGPGSDPFTGRVEFEGEPIDRANLRDTDTLVQRSSDPVDPDDGAGTQGTVEIEIVALKLVSVEPIQVTYDDGARSTEWTVRASLSATPAPTGSLTATKTHGNGGIFNSTLPVQPGLRFGRVGPDCDCLDLDGLGDPASLADFGLFRGCFGESSPTVVCPPEQFDCSDLDQTGGVNLADFAIVQLLFGSQSSQSPPDCVDPAPLPRVIEWDTAGSLNPLEFIATGVPFVHTLGSGLNVHAPPGSRFVPGVVESVPGNPASQTETVTAEEERIARHTVCPPRKYVADLDTDSDNNNGMNNPDRSAVEDAIETDAPGEYILLNVDDDNDNEIPDLSEEPLSPPENDVVPMILELTPNEGPGSWKLIYPATVHVYDSDTTPPTLIRSGAVFPVPMVPNPKRLLVEGVAVSTSLGDVSIRLDYDCDGDGQWDQNDTVVVTVITPGVEPDSAEATHIRRRAAGAESTP